MRLLAAATIFVLAAPRLLSAQERGAVALGEAVAGLDVTTRVLMIGAHPDDEDTHLLTWLARGRQVETGYLSLTRGDGGQNLIGNELGPLLGMIRTEELLAARRLDGGRQFFTRAYDFGFSKSAEETYTHWVKDSILRDVVTVVRAFRPHVIVAVFSGTPRDGHGHHQVSGLLAREVFDAAADTVRFPRSTTLGLGAWLPSKFYRAARFNPTDATLSFNVGELSPFRGMTYAEIASVSRSQHLSQGFGALQRRGTWMDYVKLEASHVSPPIARETSMLETLGTGWGRFAGATLRPPVRAALDSLPAAVAAVRQVENLVAPGSMVEPLARVLRLITTVRAELPCARNGLAAGCTDVNGDLAVSLETAERRAQTALLAAAGVLVEATASRELVAVGDTISATVTVYNQGKQEIRFAGASAWTLGDVGPLPAGGATTIAPDSSARIAVTISAPAADYPWWMARQRVGDMFTLPPRGDEQANNLAIGENRLFDTHARAALVIAGVPLVVDASPVIYRFADPARGELRRPVASVPPISVRFDGELELARAGVPLNRGFALHVRSASSLPRSLTVDLTVPAGLTVDSARRAVALRPFGEATVTYNVRGTLPAGEHRIEATATSGEDRFAIGWSPIEYEHIRPLRYYRYASVQMVSVPAALPRNPRIAYITGVGDNVAPLLDQLDLQVTTLRAEEFATTPLSRFGAIVVGPRAFAASPVLAAHASRLQEFARAGGTVVVQYGQQEMQVPGLLPYPITLERTAQRVTEETAPVTVLDPSSRLLAYPNRITAQDFAGWVQERALYMPATADPRWRRLFEMHDPGEGSNEHAVLVAPLGKGTYVYTTLALFRQLPAGVPGGARLLLNLIAANGQMTASTTPQP
ncbi:MAG TPA: PIG-L family deacetylase [Gemmatimonadaceae bacterium]|nr:PIG-L family deacetylase [Gemmatimonadaceae bacterium]